MTKVIKIQPSLSFPHLYAFNSNIGTANVWNQ